MHMRTYPGRLTREEWLKAPMLQRRLLVSRAQSDLLDLWRTCRKKPCRRAHSCRGDVRCPLRVHEADWKSPSFGQPDFKSSFHYSDHFLFAAAVLKHLHFGPEPLPAEDIVAESALQSGVDAAASLRLVLRLQRRRRGRAAIGK
ncbi:MAG: hypothetical protein ACRECV_15995 [Xanthobacteraceae bacterium]